jgi:putative membrane protein
MSLLLVVSRHRRAVLATTAVGTAAVLAFAGPVTAAFGEGSGTPVVQTSETVKASLTASGKVDVARLFSQIEASGKGRVSLSDPTSTRGLRNLDGWGGPSTSGGNANYNFSVNGEKHFRTVAKYTEKLPVSINATYKLDGKSIQPGDLAGKSGKLDVSYTVVNTTGAPTEISYLDGHGKNLTETVNIVTPYVGQLALDLPKSFDDLASTGNRADQAGDGHGGRLVTWTMVLFEPIGATTQKFGFSANVDNAALPSASVQLVPVVPQNHPELKFGQDGFSSGAKSGQDLTAGATQIDDNVLKLRDGAATLLTGLTQLQTGANQLSTGLSSGVPAAVNGSQKLANGIQTAADGAGQLTTGSSQLSAGANKLSRGFNNPNSDNDLIDGSQSLAGALGLISGGLGQLNSASTGLPAAKAGLVAIKSAIDTQVIPKVGTTSSPCDLTNPAKQTLVSCMQLLIGGVTQLGTSHSQVQALAGLPSIRDGVSAAKLGLNGNPAAPDVPHQLGIRGGVGAVQSGLQGAVNIPGSIDDLASAIKNSGDCGPACKATVDALINSPGPLPSPPFPVGTTSLRETTTAANEGLLGVLAAIGAPASTSPGDLNGGLNLIGGGLDSAIAQVNSLLLPGLQGIQTGLLTLRAGLTNADANKGTGNPACNPAIAAGALGYCGLSEGLTQLVGGITTAVTGISQLAPGAAAANVGAGDLADGIATAGDGVAQLSVGALQLNHGSAQLAAGLKNQLAPGAVKLSDGLQDLNAANAGAKKISDGLGDAKAGDKQIVDGAGKLSSQGTSQLVASGDDTAKSYGKQYATMQALNKKGADNALPVGAPKGSTDNRGAFDITLAGVGHQGPGSPGRGIAAIVILGIGAAATTLLRGRFGA